MVRQLLYEHRYKHGKQKIVLPLGAIESLIQDAVNSGESMEHLAFVVFLAYSGVRKSEAYERTVEDVTVTKDFVVVDFHTRKKRGLQTEPNEIPRFWYGVNEVLVPYLKKRAKAKPTKKRIFYQENKETKSRVEKQVWLFPHIQSWTAWRVTKKILGEKYYPHYLRLWRLSKAAQTTDNMGDMISAVRRVSGLKSLSAMEAYFGDNEEVGKRAMRELK